MLRSKTRYDTYVHGAELFKTKVPIVYDTYILSIIFY